LIELVDAVRPAVAALDSGDRHYVHRGATFFEVTAAMGLLHFARQGVGAVVLEVGMGGRLDSTNVVRPILGIITTISFDHTRQLGSTLGAIAAEKAGILKRGRPAVSGVRGDEARSSIHRIAKLRGTSLREIDTDFDYIYHTPEPPLTRPTAGSVTVTTWRRRWPTVRLPMLGSHQAQNAALALASLDALAEQGFQVEPEDVARGFAGLKGPARVEIVGEDPWIVVDGAHNVASAKALAETLRTCFPPSPITLVFGTTREKDLPGQLQALLPLASIVIATRYVENPRSVPPEEVAEAVRAFDGRDVHLAPGPAEALDLARRLSPPHALICVTGSLFLAAETRAIVLHRDDPQTAQAALI
jgi:dihydrofolate synthase/folylpolyglutamate synthase